MQEAPPGSPKQVEGAYLMPSFGRYEVVARVAEAVLAGARQSS